MAIKKKKPVGTSTKKPVSKPAKKSSVSSASSLRDRAKGKLQESQKKGFTAMREAKKERQFSNSWRGFFVSKGDSKPVLFLMDDLVTRRVHTLVSTTKTGKTFYPEVLCTEDDDCTWCERAKDGDKSVRTASTTGATLILDVDGYKTDDKEVPWVVRPWSVNPTLASVLEHRDNKEGIKYTMFDATKLDRGISLDVVRDDDDEIQRFDNPKEIIKYLRGKDGNKETADTLQAALDEHGSFSKWLEEEIIPDWWSGEGLEVASSSSSDDDDDGDSGSSYSFRKKGKKSAGKDSKPSKRSRLR